MKRFAGVNPISIGAGNDFPAGAEIPDDVWRILDSHRQKILVEQRRVIEVDRET